MQDLRKQLYWSDDETFKLIELWGEDRIQAQLEGCKRNKEVYSAIFEKLLVAGYQKSGTQCRDKAKKLKKSTDPLKISMEKRARKGGNGCFLNQWTRY